MKSLPIVGLLALVLAPPAGADQLQAGIALYNGGKFAEAEATLRKAAGPQAQAYLSASLARQKKYVEAEAPARAALEATPGSAVAAAGLGESLVGQKKYDDAVTSLGAVIKANPEAPYAHYWRAQAYQNKKQIARMVEDYQAFLKLAPDAPEAASVKVLLAGLR